MTSAFDNANPAFTEAELAALAVQHFGLSGTIRPLPSERDQNARLTAGAADYVLKIANPAEDPEQIALQTATMRHLAAVGMPGIPRLIPTQGGADFATVMVGDKPALMRLVSWVGGTPMARTPRSLPQLAALGGFMGRLTTAMQGFGHPAAFRPDFPWSLDHVARLRFHADDIADRERRALVVRLFDRYAIHIAPRLPRLRASVLHQDANDWNVIADADHPARIAGLIDFGDMCHGRTVNELAIALAYALLDAGDIVAAMRAVIGGFAAAFPLTGDEADLVYDLMRMRLVASVCISSRQSKQHPDNAYLLISQQPAFALLERLGGYDPGVMIGLCRKAAGLAASDKTDAIRADLATRTIGAVLQTDPNRLPRVALPARGGLADMPAFTDPAFEDWFLGQRPAGLPADVPFIGLIPYGDGEDMRTLGLCLVAPAGTAILAPLDGTVESVANGLTLRHHTGEGVPFLTRYRHITPVLPPATEVSKGDVIGHIGSNKGQPAHLHMQILTGPDQTTPTTAQADLWDVWSDLCPDPNLLLRLSPESFAIDPVPPRAVLDARRRAIGRSLSLSYREKLKIVRGRGAWLIDHTGRQYLDTVNNITHVGHCHPHVVQALARQAAELNTNSRYLHPLMPALADRIAATLPGDLSVVTFVNSGTEANELALRIARTALGKKDTVVLDWAYHGNSGGTVEISPYKFKRKGGFPQPDFVQIAAFPDPYRGAHRGLDSGPAYAADIDRCLDAVRQRTGAGAATFIAESVSGVGGQVVLPQGYLQGVYDRIRAAGGICIADEVQCGFGRVGSAFWGFELQGVVPDIVVLGKPIGNGHPLAAVVTTPELADRFANGMEYFNSFGGNPVSMAVGHAVLDVIETEDLQTRALSTGDLLMAGFRDLAQDFPIIGDVRGSGLFVGVELVDDRDRRDPATAAVEYVVDQLRRRGVLSSTDGPDDNVLKIKPPMVFGPDHAAILLAETAAALSSLPE